MTQRISTHRHLSLLLPQRSRRNGVWWQSRKTATTATTTTDDKASEASTNDVNVQLPSTISSHSTADLDAFFSRSSAAKEVSKPKTNSKSKSKSKAAMTVEDFFT